MISDHLPQHLRLKSSILSITLEEPYCINTSFVAVHPGWRDSCQSLLQLACFSPIFLNALGSSVNLDTALLTPDSRLFMNKINSMYVIISA